MYFVASATGQQYIYTGTIRRLVSIRSLQAGAIAGWDLHPLESASFARRPPEADIKHIVSSQPGFVSAIHRLSQLGLTGRHARHKSGHEILGRKFFNQTSQLPRRIVGRILVNRVRWSGTGKQEDRGLGGHCEVRRVRGFGVDQADRQRLEFCLV
jgi:hypothetical protein